MPKKFENKEEERKYYRERKQIQKTKKSSESVTTQNEIQHDDFVITPKLEPPQIQQENDIINNFLENLSESIQQVELNEDDLNEVELQNFQPMIFNAIIQHFLTWQIKINKVHKQMSLLKKLSRLYI